MTLDEAIELIQADFNDNDVEWDSPLGRAYKLSFEALKTIKGWRHQATFYARFQLEGETEE